ncbi:MAG TPA: hypothetical protein VMR81_05485 [Patescibacteria group bacterium]|nr:hypothetical protein [Patescibacteria group bacterium]
MKRLLASVLVVAGFLLVTHPVFATSAQAYQDFLYQFDVYRQNYSDFQVSKNEYQKFQSLTAQTDALAKTKTMLAERDQLLRSYLLLLDEKLAEDQGLTASTKVLYQTLVRNEASFLADDSSKIQAVASIPDAVQASSNLESHYNILQSSIKQILIGLGLGQLSLLSQYYDTNVKTAQTLIANYSGSMTPDKQQTVNRWILQIQNKRSFYQQKYDEITAEDTNLTARDSQGLDDKYNTMTQGLADARQYLVEGASYLVELKNELKYSQ